MFSQQHWKTPENALITFIFITWGIIIHFTTNWSLGAPVYKWCRVRTCFSLVMHLSQRLSWCSQELFVIGTISLMSPIVIKVPTRAPLAVETKRLLFLWLANLNNKSNVCKQISPRYECHCFLRNRTHYSTSFPGSFPLMWGDERHWERGWTLLSCLHRRSLFSSHCVLLHMAMASNQPNEI